MLLGSLFLLPLTTQAADSLPGRFVADATAQRLQQRSTSSSHSRVSARWAETKRQQVEPERNAWRLRFKENAAPAVSRVSAIRSEPAFRSVVQAGFTTARASQGSGLNSTVRLATQLEPLDPFDDPFGDRSATSESADDEVPTASQAQPDADGLPSPFGSVDSAPEPPAQFEPAPPTPSAGEPCDRIYNGRDCCESEADCKRAQARIRDRSLRHISVDITPRLTVAKIASDANGIYERELELNLAESPSRVWRNVRGEVLADGRLVDFRDGRIMVETTDGNRVQIPFADLSDDDNCFVTAWWSIPSECTMGDESLPERDWIATTLTWKASALCHKPLYFEEVQLERYGHTAGPIVQPVLSGAHFFLNVAALPYQMGIHPPNECHYALGYYRPGNCAPWLLPPVPLSVRGGLLQAGVLTGGVFMIP